MRILIVEDEKEIADGIQLILEKEGYMADAVYDGLSGLDYALGGVYDLILLDIMLPKLNGIQLLTKVREEGIKIPIILLTAKSLVNDKILGLDKGADDYLTKPFDAGELLARIRARIRNTDSIKQGKIVAYDIELDPCTYRVSCCDKSVKLSKTEYHLLEYLMINRGQILTKDMIINKIWGYDEKTEYNNLEVYVSFLRKKMKFLQTKSNIVTKKGIGYLLEE